MDRYLHKFYQGRKWLSKTGGASSNAAAMAAPSILPKGGGAIAPPPVTPMFTITVKSRIMFYF
jgi:hypothetical protein